MEHYATIQSANLSIRRHCMIVHHFFRLCDFF